jgi:UDP:flavonoid glycosyltransferase YjiC (YdhE family)
MNEDHLTGRQAALVISLEQLIAGHLQTLLNNVLNNSTYWDNARKLQKTIAKASGLSVAAI